MKYQWAALFILGVLLCTSAGVEAADGKAKGKIEFNVLRIDGLVIGKKIAIDEEFARKYKIEVKAPFEFIVPKETGVKIFAAFPPETGGEWTKISFATEDKKLIENLRFTSLTVPLGEESQRVAILQDLLVKKGMPKALKGYPKTKILGARPMKIKDLAGVEAIAAYEDPDVGLMFVWMVGILNPKSPNGVMAIVQINPKKSQVTQPADIGKKGIAAKSLSTFKFITK